MQGWGEIKESNCIILKKCFFFFFRNQCKSVLKFEVQSIGAKYEDGQQLCHELTNYDSSSESPRFFLCQKSQAAKILDS